MADLSQTLPLERSSVLAAHKLIKPFIHETPVLTCITLNDLASTPQSPESLVGTPFEGQVPARPKINFFFKCENYQRIGAFKSRGAFHALAQLSDEQLKNGVVTHSSGNHAQALALAARTRGIPAYIVMPTISTPTKIAATKGYGAHVIFSGSTSEEREAVVEDVIARTHARLVPPYDHPDIILGQGTMALELETQYAALVAARPALSVRGEKGSRRAAATPGPERTAAETRANGTDAPRLDAVIAPLGGGGMLAGIATALSRTPTRVYGAEPSFQGADDGRRSLASGRRIASVRSLTIADGLRTPVGAVPWTVIRDAAQVRGVFCVSEEQIVAAMRLVLERMKVVVEPSAVVGLAVALWDEAFRGEVGAEGWDVGVVLSGGNASVEALGRCFCPMGGGLKGEREGGLRGVDGGQRVENVAG